MSLEIRIDELDLTVRDLNAWQWMRVKRARRRGGHDVELAAAAGLTTQQFKKLPAEKRELIRQAYLKITEPGACEPERPMPANTGPVFQKGRHRSIEEKTAIGAYLIRKKAELPRGHFGPWLDRAGMPASAAQECLRLAREGSRSSGADGASVSLPVAAQPPLIIRQESR
jgi:hypothetical protein